ECLPDFMKTSTNIPASPEPAPEAADFTERVRVNQAKLTSELRPQYDFIVCGSGSSGSVVARRLAENPMSACCCWKLGAGMTSPALQRPLNGRPILEAIGIGPFRPGRIRI